MSVNKVILIGNVGKEPDVRHLDRNVVVANMVLATTERGYAQKYVHKGDRIYIEGKIRTNTYEDQNGIRRYRTEILAEAMDMLSSRAAGAAPVQEGPVQGNGF